MINFIKSLAAFRMFERAICTILLFLLTCISTLYTEHGNDPIGDVHHHGRNLDSILQNQVALNSDNFSYKAKLHNWMNMVNLLTVPYDGNESNYDSMNADQDNKQSKGHSGPKDLTSIMSSFDQLLVVKNLGVLQRLFNDLLDMEIISFALEFILFAIVGFFCTLRCAQCDERSYHFSYSLFFLRLIGRSASDANAAAGGALELFLNEECRATLHLPTSN